LIKYSSVTANHNQITSIAYQAVRGILKAYPGKPELLMRPHDHWKRQNL
jgi:hypothetical protein